MKLINKNNFFSKVCIVYTILSVVKIIIETIYRTYDSNYENFIWLIAVSTIITFVLSLHYYLKNFPLWLVIIGQYLVILAAIFLCVWLEGNFVMLHPDAYKDMFRSITIFYFMGATYYYISFWNQVKKANVILTFLKEKNKKEI